MTVLSLTERILETLENPRLPAPMADALESLDSLEASIVAAHNITDGRLRKDFDEMLLVTETMREFFEAAKARGGA